LGKRKKKKLLIDSKKKYADPVMDKIDKNRVCSLRLFRENCTLYNGVFVKDMALMNRDLKDIIIIDVIQ